MSSAYDAALHAARAALSEQDQNPRTHRGAWGELHRRFVVPGLIAAEVHAAAAALQQIRQQADYEAGEITRDDAEEAVDAAAALVEAVRRLDRAQSS